MTQTLRLEVTGMTCGGCVRRAETALSGVDGVSAARVNLATRRAEVDMAGTGSIKTLAQALEKAGYPAAIEDMRLQVDGATCGSCAARIEGALTQVSGVEQAAFNLATGQARVQFFAGAVTADMLIAAVKRAGYTATAQLSGDQAATREAEEVAGLQRDTLLAACLTLPVVVLAMGGHVVPAFHHWVANSIGITTSWVVQFILTTVVLAWPGQRFFRLGLPALLHRAPDMNALVVMGASAAWAFSTLATFAGGWLPQGTRDVYFEAAAVIVTLILMGRWMEARARGRAGAAIRRLAGLQVREARVKKGEEWQEVSISSLVPGDWVEVKPGARVPVDGMIIEGHSDIDESMVTGEPIPVSKMAQDQVVGGTVNGAGPLVVQVTATGGNTVLSQIMEAVAEAQGAKLPVQALVDRVTAVFVPIVMVIALITFVFWLVFGTSPAFGLALVAAVSVLVVACPCAMGLATPMSIMVGTGRASELGVLFRRGDALQRLQAVDIIAFDKTGTLTEGKPALTGLAVTGGFAKDEVLQWIAALEAKSEHPVARAILAEAEARKLPVPEATAMRVHVGEGLSGDVGGHHVRIGSKRFIGLVPSGLRGKVDAWSAAGKTVLMVSVDDDVVAGVAISDRIRPEAEILIKTLHDYGISTAMITGDSQQAAEFVARELGIDHVTAEVLPTDKADAVNALKQDGKTLAFVGDGINDAPALAAADVGIALASGTDVAMEAADVVLMSQNLVSVATAQRISMKTMRNIKQNLFWAFAYNVALIPVAAGGLAIFGGPMMSPMLASGAMAMSSVLVVVNALRLRGVRAI